MRKLWASPGVAAGWLILLFGLILRIVVFIYLGPFNNDEHIDVIRFIADNGRLPRADELSQAYHPPLYYLLTAPLWSPTHHAKAVQGFSLLCSCATLCLIFLLIGRGDVIPVPARPWCLALAAFHPQFLIHSLFVSNDTLAILIGVLLMAQCGRLLARPALLQFAILGLLLGLGLLTKATFLAFIPPLIAFLLLVGRREAMPPRRLVLNLASCIGIAALIGCEPYLKHLFLYGDALASNLDMGWEWIVEQRPTGRGLRSFFDFNLFKLITEPTVSPSTVHSYPLMFYGSFWYAYIPESTFRGNVSPYRWIGGMIYALALAPTLLILAGAGRAAVAPFRRPPFKYPRADGESQTSALAAAAVWMLACNLALIMIVGLRHDVWSVFQSRLLFPAFFGVLIALAAGLEWARGNKAISRVARALLVGLFLSFGVYFFVEIALGIRHPVDPLSHEHMPFAVDMR